MFHCDQCYLSPKKYYSTLEELEIHLAIDHYKLIIYECLLCPHAKFPTETTLVDHYCYTHNITSGVKINYTLDHPSIEIRRKIQRSLSKSAATFNSIVQLNSNSVDEDTHDLCNEDVIWIPSKETLSDHSSSDSTPIQNFALNSSCELPTAHDIIENGYLSDTRTNKHDVFNDYSHATSSLKMTQYSTVSFMAEVL
uniref:C2H2-type domain-containing protein n=1 Tax=Ditylenchus dipsaci TaxID=166011 RepID=A0A915CKW3_9BILA